MQIFPGKEATIAYAVEGTGAPVLLIHGFASNARTNWRDTGWMRFLASQGFQAIAFDNRGHGGSQKFYDPAAYTGEAMAEDARGLLAHLQIPRADIVGYSMGARIAAFLAMAHPEMVRRVTFGGLGAAMIRGLGDPEPIAAALLAEDGAAGADAKVKAFRTFADQTISDRRALAACIRATRGPIPAQALAALKMPVLVATGTLDAISGPPQPLADVIEGAQILEIPGCDHMKAVGSRAFKQGVLEFLKLRE